MCLSKVETGDIVWPEKPRKRSDEVLKPILNELGLSEGDLKRHGLAVRERKTMAIELLCRLSRASQREMMPLCGYRRESSVGKQRRALRGRLEADPAFARRFHGLRKKLEKGLEC